MAIQTGTSHRRGGSPAIALLVVLTALLLAAPAGAAPIADEAAVVYDPHAVAAIDLTLSPETIADLEAEPSEYVKGTFEVATTSGGPGGEETALTPSPLAVEVRLKGSGSFRPITGKAAFKLKFKKAEAFLGLRKITLNNMVQDDSMAHEALAYLAFGAVGAPAPRSGYAYLRLNGEDFGLYANVETLDKVALEKRFGTFEDPQHLYEGEIDDDVTPGGAGLFEVDEGDEAERADLEALIEAVNGSGEEPWSEHVTPFADLDEMTRMWAVEHYVAHWDGYAGNAEPAGRPNNYYLYSDVAGRFQMLPWGTDQTWDLNLDIPTRVDNFDTEGGVMFNLCLEDDDCSRAYWEALGEVTDAVEAIDPGAFLAAAAAMLAPWQQREREFGRAESSAGEVTAAVNEAAAFIANRPEEAHDWLVANAPPPPPPEEESKQPPAELTPVVESIPVASSVAVAPLRQVRLGRVERAGGTLIVRLGFAGPGEVRVRATMRLRGRAVTACAATAAIPDRGRQAISCPLSPAALERLEDGAVSLRLGAAFTASAGGQGRVGRGIRLAGL